MRSIHLPVTCIASLSLFALGSACDETVESTSIQRELNSESPPELVYERVIHSKEGKVQSDSSFGVITPSIWERVARPWYFTQDSVAYEEMATIEVDEGANVIHSYRITQRPVLPAASEPSEPVSKVPFIDEALESLLDEDIPVSILLDDHHPWHPPFIPRDEPLPDLSPEHIEELRSSSADLIKERRQYVDAASSALRLWLTSKGATVHSVSLSGPWVFATIPADSLDDLSSREDVKSIRHDPAQTGTGDATTYLGDLRARAGFDVQPFWDAGYYGNDATFPLKVAIFENNPFNDEACLFYDFANCTGTTRLKSYRVCDNSACTATSDYTGSADSFHGTAIASIIGGDYSQGQGDGYLIGDSGTSHSAAWELARTGIAKEVDFYLFSNAGTTPTFNDARWVNAIACAQGATSGCTKVDVTSHSVSVWPSCNGAITNGGSPVPGYNHFDLANLSPVTTAYEDAFDAGLFSVVTTGNLGTAHACTARGWGVYPKTFTVAGVGLVTSSQYNTTLLDEAYTVRGGADIRVGGTLFTGSASVVDLAAPSSGWAGLTSGNPHETGEGRGNANSGANGTSFAAPVIAGMALLVKHNMLSIGANWISSPGWLHTMMLLMGDRADGPFGTTRRDSGADPYFGMGRAKLRAIPGPGSFLITVYNLTFTGSNGETQTFMPWGPLSANRKMAKCVLYQIEDMSSKTDIGLYRLEMRVRAPSGGSCVIGQGSVARTVTDFAADWKHYTYVSDSQVNINGQCIEFAVERNLKGTASTGSVKLACYASTEEDYSP